MFETTELVAFLAGTAVGAAGQYMADRFTDQRRKSEARSEAKQTFFRIQAAMSDLINEMRKDLRQPEPAVVREFVALPNKRVTFDSDRARFVYFESEHRNIMHKVSMLVEAGYARNVSSTQTPIYRISEEFYRQVKDNA